MKIRLIWKLKKYYLIEQKSWWDTILRQENKILAQIDFFKEFSLFFACQEILLNTRSEVIGQDSIQCKQWKEQNVYGGSKTQRHWHIIYKSVGEMNIVTLSICLDL